MPWTSRFPFWENNFSFSLAKRARDEASHPQIKSLNKHTNTCPGQAKFESNLSKGKLEFMIFSQPRKECIYNTKLETMVTLSSPSFAWTVESKDGLYVVTFSCAFLRTRGEKEYSHGVVRRPHDTCFSPGIHTTFNRPFPYYL